jgi:phosphate-selective porin OprO/OprP
VSRHGADARPATQAATPVQIMLALVLLMMAATTGGQEPEPAPVATASHPEAYAPDEDDAPQTETATIENEPKTAELTDKEVALANQSFSEKWRTFRQASQGLLVWDLFDGRVTIRSHARVKVDGTAARGNDTFEAFYGELGESLDFRELSLWAQGTIDHKMRYSLSFDFGADRGLGDAFVEGREEGLSVFGYRIGQFRLGFFQEPFSFERVMSSHYIGFHERSLPVGTFSPGYNVGYMLYDTALNERMQWAVGFFSFGQTNEANASGSVLSVTARVSGLPVFKNDGRTLFHVGASFSTREPRGGTVQYRSRPEARFVDFLIDTGDIDAGRIELFGVESAAVLGSLHVQAELMLSHLSQTAFGDLALWGGYLEAGWFLTGEHHSYDRELGVFSRMQPKADYRGGVRSLFSGNRGGAFELVGRVSTVDLNDGALHGGRMTNVTVGFNWHLSPTSIIKLDGISSSVEDRGRASIFLLRYQYRPMPIPGWR